MTQPAFPLGAEGGLGAAPLGGGLGLEGSDPHQGLDPLPDGGPVQPLPDGDFPELGPYGLRGKGRARSGTWPAKGA